MRKPIIVAAVAGALAVGGTAVAASGGPGELFGGDPERDFAQDLADELGGDVSAGEVENALEAVAENHAAERREAMAEAIVEHLDGVTAAEAADALAVFDQRMREGVGHGDPPDPGTLAEVLSEELGVSEDEIDEALGAIREEAFDEIGKRMREDGGPPMVHHSFAPGGPMGPGGPPDIKFAMPIPED